MKKMYILKVTLLAFLAFQFVSCENEPLTGEFPQQDSNGAEEGQFIARIAGQEFIANSVSAILSEEQRLTITGADASGKRITLVVKSLVDSNYAFGDEELGQAWAQYGDASDVNGLSYSTSQALSAIGNLTFTNIDREAKKLSGNFNFNGIRIKLDESGMPVMDGNGLPVMENIQITDGAFNTIAYTLESGDDGDGDGDGELPADEFFAKVNDNDFLAETITVSESVIANNHMIKIQARSATNELIRIDVPRALGVGTFDMMTISDGTKLIGIYKTNGGENLTSHDGRITITEFDLEAGVLTATFRFNAKDPLGVDISTARVREGRMTVHFEGIPGANNAMTARVDGNTYAPDTVDVESSVVNQYPRITLISRVGDQEMRLSFPRTITVGTFDMVTEADRGNEVVGTFIPVAGISIPYFSDRGSFVVTNYDMANGIIEGTFNFTAVDASGQDSTEYQITSGEFLAVLP